MNQAAGHLHHLAPAAATAPDNASAPAGLLHDQAAAAKQSGAPVEAMDTAAGQHTPTDQQAAAPSEPQQQVSTLGVGRLTAAVRSVDGGRAVG
jgi:hypothetical protein